MSDDDSDRMCAGASPIGIQRSDDRGAIWRRPPDPDDLLRLADLPHLGSMIVQSDTHAEGMLDGHAITVSPAEPDVPIIALGMGKAFGTRDGGETSEAIPLPGLVKDTYAVACG